MCAAELDEQRARCSVGPRLDGAQALPGAPGQFVIVGSGKTATDACIWLLGNGVDPAKDLRGSPARPVDVRPCCVAARSGGVLRLAEMSSR